MADAVTDWLKGNAAVIQEPSILAMGMIVPPDTEWCNVQNSSEYFRH